MAETSTISRVTRVRPDSKGRIALGKLAEGVSSYRVKVESHGKITLEPYAEIPARERWLFENPEALHRVRKGLAEAEAGKTVSLGSFSRRRK
jgi:hypothetical protein